MTEIERPTVRCGNRAAHGGEPGYHYTTSGVRECYASTGRFSAPSGIMQVPATRRMQITHGQVVRQAGQYPVADLSSEQVVPVDVLLSMGQQMAQSRQAHDTRMSGLRAASEQVLPEITADDAVARMRANLDAQQAAEKAAQYARYAAWRSIPVYASGRAYYALEMDGKTHFFKVSRPKKGPHKGKTFVEEQAGDNFHKMAWARTGEVLDALAADPEAAGLLYGQTIGQCYRCHRTLTDDTSRALGMGPDCAKKG